MFKGIKTLMLVLFAVDVLVYLGMVLLLYLGMDRAEHFPPAILILVAFLGLFGFIRLGILMVPDAKKYELKKYTSIVQVEEDLPFWIGSWDGFERSLNEEFDRARKDLLARILKDVSQKLEDQKKNPASTL
jgi:hypothetical protein